MMHIPICQKCGEQAEMQQGNKWVCSSYPYCGGAIPVTLLIEVPLVEKPLSQDQGEWRLTPCEICD